MITFSYILIIIGIILFFIVSNIKGPEIKLEKKKKNPDIAILIPARNESNVILNIIKSIKKQSVKIDSKNVYVIVESEDDPTVKICKKNNISVIVRKHLDLKTKGYALDEAFKYLKKENKKYDLYFIFDADNILDKDYIKNMVDSYYEGYDIATGYRKSSNVNVNKCSVCSALVFTLINSVDNKEREKHNKQLTLSGTGYYMTYDVVKDFGGGFPFHGLTEDKELSLYSIVKNYSMHYNENAIFYDEQPTYMGTSMKQKARWIKGYFNSEKKYDKTFKSDLTNPRYLNEIIGVVPYLFMIFGLVIQMFYWLFTNIFLFLLFLFVVYLALATLTLYFLYLDSEKLGINSRMIQVALLYNPIYLCSFIPSFLYSLIMKNTWEVIPHTGVCADKVKI